MSGSDPSVRPWKLLIRHAAALPTAGSSAELARNKSVSPTECPVCRRPHGAQLVRQLSVEPLASSKWAESALPASKYYPPPVPILSERSTSPIGRSARWSLSVPEQDVPR